MPRCPRSIFWVGEGRASFLSLCRLLQAWPSVLSACFRTSGKAAVEPSRVPLDARSLVLEGRLQDGWRGRGGGLCLQVGARAGSLLCSPRAGLGSPFPRPSPLPSCPRNPTPPRWRFCLFNHRGSSLAGAPALDSAPRVTLTSKPERTGGRGLASGKGCWRKRQPHHRPRPAPPPGAVVATSRREAADRAGRTPGRPEAAGRGHRRRGGLEGPCARARWGAGWALPGARRLQPTSGSLSSPRGLCLKTQIRHGGGAQPALERGPETTGPAPRQIHVPAPCGALVAPGPACRAPETRASWTVSPRKCPASTDYPAGAVVPRPLHRHHGQMRSVSPTPGAGCSRAGRRPGPRP